MPVGSNGTDAPFMFGGPHFYGGVDFEGNGLSSSGERYSSKRSRAETSFEVTLAIAVPATTGMPPREWQLLLTAPRILHAYVVPEKPYLRRELLMYPG